MGREIAKGLTSRAVSLMRENPHPTMEDYERIRNTLCDEFSRSPKAVSTVIGRIRHTKKYQDLSNWFPGSSDLRENTERIIRSESRDPSDPDDQKDLEKYLIESEEPIRMIDVLDQYDISPGELRDILDTMRSRGIEIFERDGRIYSGELAEGPTNPIDTLGSQEILFGACADLHGGAKACQWTAFRKYIDECYSRGVRHILIAGDLCDGAGIYPGQELEQYASTADEQEASVINNIPRKPGLKYFVLGGNHDWSFMKNGRGHNCLRVIETQREDINFIGWDRQRIPILPGIDAILWHPGGGAAYARSYKIQKAVENLAFSEWKKMVQEMVDGRSQVRFFLGGHFHFQFDALFGPLLAAQLGCFAGENNLTRRMGVDPVIGGYIIHAELDRNGNWKGYIPEFRTYPEIKSDWKDYDHDPQEDKPLKPILMDG